MSVREERLWDGCKVGGVKQRERGVQLSGGSASEGVQDAGVQYAGAQ